MRELLRFWGNNIIYANVSKFYEYCNKFVGKSLIKVFYFVDWGNISQKFFTIRMNEINYMNLSLNYVLKNIGNTSIKSKKIIFWI